VTQSEYYSSFAVINQGIRRDNIFSTRDQHWHSQYRRAINPAFTLSALLKNEHYVDDTGKLLFEKLDCTIEERGTKHAIDLPRLLQFFAFDVVGMLAYGRNYGFIVTDTDIDGIISTTRGVADHLSRVRRINL
jgi:Cytochrome P450